MNLFTSNSELFSKTFIWLFFSVVFIFMLTTELVFRFRVADTHAFEIYKKKYNTELADVVMFGDSHVANGIITSDRILNLGYAGNNLITMTTMAVEYTKKRNVRYIGLQADPHMFSYYRIAKDQSRQLDSLLRNKKPFLYIFEPHLRKYLIEYWKAWLTNPKKLFFKDNQKKIIKGHEDIHSILEIDAESRKKQASIRVQMHKPIDSFEKSETAVKFSESIQEILDLGKKVCLISYPVSSDYRAASKIYKQFSNAYEYFDSLSKSKKIKYINFSNSYEDKYFSDVDHLNLNGSTLLTEEIIRNCVDKN